LHMEASQHSLLAACFTLHSINATLATVPQRGAGLWIRTDILYLLHSVQTGSGTKPETYSGGIGNFPRNEATGV
jgi:hypothetical protein